VPAVAWLPAAASSVPTGCCAVEAALAILRLGAVLVFTRNAARHGFLSS